MHETTPFLSIFVISGLLLGSIFGDWRGKTLILWSKVKICVGVNKSVDNRLSKLQEGAKTAAISVV
jgi:hypothetical protein